MSETKAPDWQHLQHLSNAHLVHAAMPTIVASVEALAEGEGMQISGLIVDGRDANLTLENKVIVALVKHILGAVDGVCVALLSDAPAPHKEPPHDR